MNESWIEIPFKEVVKYQKGKKPKRLEDVEFEDSIPYLDIKAFEKGEIRRYADVESSNIIDSDSVGVVWDGARSGWVTKGQSGAIGSTIAKLTPIHVDVDYLFWFLESNFHELNSNTKGTGIPHVNPEIIWNLKFPLAPLDEQKRISQQLDTIFEKLNQNKARLERIPKLLKDFREIVLESIISENCDKIEFTKLLLDLKYGTSAKGYKDKVGIPVLRIPNMNDMVLNFDDLKYSQLSRNEIEKYSLTNGDLLMIRSNGSVSLLGKTSLVEYMPEEMIYAGYLMRLRINSNLISPKLLNFIMRTRFVRDQIEMNARSTTGVNNINTKEVKSLIIPIPKIDIQKRVLDKVEELFALADEIEQKFEQAKTKINHLPQAILAKAFRGELVEQNPNDEPASELIKKIKEDKKLTKKKNEK